MSLRLGLIRTLAFYPFYPLWDAFFRRLGFELVISPPMNQAMFDRGTRRFVGDTCLPVESSFYHVEALRGRVDAVFVPASNDMRRDIYVCPLCAGLPAMIRSAFPDGPDVLSINLTPLRGPRRKDLLTLARWGVRPGKVREAYKAALQEYAAFGEAVAREPWLARAWSDTENAMQGVGPRVLLLGMPYVLNDPFVNANLPRLLAAHGCRITTAHMSDPNACERLVTVLGYTIPWSFAGQSIAALSRELRKGGIDGVIYCSSFACGVDSLITPIVKSVCRRVYPTPYLLLMLDEHSETSHLEVRIEAFLDCIHRTAGRMEAGGT